jgi:ABC-type antimicrobial peptide transport system permease subunit
MVLARTREMGIRMALGAPASRVLRMIFGHGMAIALAGTAVGMALAIPAVRALRSTLFNVTPFQPYIVVTVVTLMLLAAVLASWLPARRATRVDPAESLRWD